MANQERFHSLQEAETAIEKYELTSNTRYSMYKKDKSFNTPDFDILSHKILFEDRKPTSGDRQIVFSGIPFIVIGNQLLDCIHGKDHHKSKKTSNDKANIEAKNETSYSKTFKKSRFLSQDTKKLGCTAKIIMRDVVFFTDFMIDKNTERKKRTVAEKLKSNWNKNKSTVKMERYIYVKLPDKKDHSGHLIGEMAGLSQNVDDRIISKIYQLVGEGVRNVREMSRHIRIFVKSELFPGESIPIASNRRYLPTLKDIRNHMYKASVKNRFAKLDQANLECKVDQWQKDFPKDKFFFRGYGTRIEENVVNNKENIKDQEGEEKEDNEEGEDIEMKQLKTKQRLLYAHETELQRRLLGIYGNHICLLDATYKTTKYAIPLFFLAIKTNVDYQIIGSFAVQDETAEAITEALSIFKQWNPTWNPKCFMVDNCEEEITSIEHLFPDTSVLLCDFHREQAWERWLSKASNGMRSVKDLILPRLRRIAHADTKEEYAKSVSDLKESEYWNGETNKRFREWMSKTWLPAAKKWVKYFRQGLMEIIVNTNNGVERKNKDFKHEFLKQFKDNSISGMITVLVEQFLPETYRRYVEANVRRCSEYRSYNKNLPLWLHNRPPAFTKHCIKRISQAMEINEILSLKSDSWESPRRFKVPSLSNDGTYTVSLGAKDDISPSCECMDWKRIFMPCKHLLAVMASSKERSWEMLPIAYTSSPFYNLDYGVISTTPITPMNNNDENNFTQVEDEVILENIPAKMYPKRTKASQCREILNQIKSLTYLVHDAEVIEQLEEDLNIILKSISKAAPNDDGLVQERIKVKRRIPKQSTLTDELPKPKKKKSNLSGRIGVSTERRKKATSINVNAGEIESNIIVEGIAPDDNASYDVPIINEISKQETNENKMEDDGEVKELDQVEEDEVEIVGEVNSHATIKKEEEEGAKNEEDEIEIIGEVKPHGIIKKRRNIKFSKEERSVIENNEMLSDESINIAMNILHNQFPEFDGLNDTSIGKCHEFDIFKPSKPYIQILHAGSLHWICMANTNTDRQVNEHHHVYDSLISSKITDDVIHQVAAYSACAKDEMQLEVVPVQQQRNGVDCGPFSIAFATSLAFGDDPKAMTFDVEKMRPHLLHCRVQRCKRKVHVIELFCSCRKPWNPSKNRNYDMAQCNKCQEWFHRTCEKIPPEAFTRKNFDWNCRGCNKK